MAEFKGQIPQKPENNVGKKPSLSRRDFLKVFGAAAAALLAGCEIPSIVTTPTLEKPVQSVPLQTDVSIRILDSYNLTPGSQEYQRLAAQSADLLKVDQQKNIVYSNRQGQVVVGSLKDIVETVSLANSDLVPDPESAAATTLPYEIKVGDQSIIINPVFFEVNNKIDPQQKGTMFFLLANVDGQWREIYLINTQGSSLSTLSVPDQGVFVNGLTEGSTNFAFPLTNESVSFDLMAVEGKPGAGAFNTVIFASVAGDQKQLVIQDENGVRMGPIPDNSSLKIGETSSFEPSSPTPLPQPTDIPLYFNVVYKLPTPKPPETPPATATETPVGPAIPQEVADKYPQGINIEYVGTDRLPLANDASSGNLIGWYSKKDSAWHFADEGMQMQYIENFDILGPAVITEVVKTDDITAQTLADWEAKINLPGEVIFGTADDISIAICPAQRMILENLVLTNFIDERVTLNPGLAAQTDLDRVWFNFAFRKNNISHTLKVETRAWIGYSGTLWHIDSQEILSKFELGKKFYTNLQVVRPESECTNKQLLALSQTSMDPLTWRFTIGRLGDIKISIEELKALLSDHNEVILTRDQARVITVSPYNLSP